MSKRSAAPKLSGSAEGFRGKRFLITQSALRLLAGSELVAVELAEFLRAQGASVLLYACFVADPLAQVIREKNLKVVAADEELRLDDFDYVWVQHQVVPVPFVEQLRVANRRHVPKFIFLHMSGLETHLLEQPYIWDLEQRLSSKTLFVSAESRDCVQRVCLDVDALAGGSALFRNPAPVSFSQSERIARAAPKTFLIVSNHPPAEIIDAKERLRAAGHEAVSLGEGQDQYKTIEPEFLQKFDAVITIGKTVQYCLCAGVPVYVYDRFGGFGFLSAGNEQQAAATNFSGRGGEKKTGEEICGELLGQYEATVRYQTENRSRFISELSIDHVLPALLDTVTAAAPLGLDAPKFYSHYLHSVLVMMKWKFIHENELALRSASLKGANQQVRTLTDDLEGSRTRLQSLEGALTEARTHAEATRRELESANASLRETRDALTTERRDREQLEAEIKKVFDSASWQATLKLRSAASLVPDGLKNRLKHLLSRRR